MPILIFFENLIASASGDWTSYGLSGAIMTSSFWNLIAYSDYDFLHFEWRHHAYLIFWNCIASVVLTSYSFKMA